MCNISKALLHALLLLVLEIVQSLQYDLKPDQIILVIQKGWCLDALNHSCFIY